MDNQNGFVSQVPAAARPRGDEQHELLISAIERMAAELDGEMDASAMVLEQLQSRNIGVWLWSSGTFVPAMESFWDASPEEWATRLSTSRAPWIGSQAWVFVDRKAVDRLIWKNAPVDASPFEFDMTLSRWPLFDVCVWVATKGRPTTKLQIASDELDTVGAASLFPYLAEQPLFGDGLRAFGETPVFGGRAQLTPDDWDGAHTGWRERGALIQFYKAHDATPGRQRDYIAADFHRRKLSEPTVLDVWLPREDVLAHFRTDGAPFVPAPPSGLRGFGLSSAVLPSIALPETAPRPQPDKPSAILPRGEGPQGLGPSVQVIADAIWHKWGAVPGGFPSRQARYTAIWKAAQERQPDLESSKRPSDDTFSRAERAVTEHLA